VSRRRTLFQKCVIEFVTDLQMPTGKVSRGQHRPCWGCFPMTSLEVCQHGSPAVGVGQDLDRESHLPGCQRFDNSGYICIRFWHNSGYICTRFRLGHLRSPGRA
jgi:hypothetical protein